jgi:uncharacterized Fe-S cluster-containing MiaB family protein
MGLETAHPEVLRKLNKGMTLEDFSSAATALRGHGIDMRAFILVPAPFLSEAEGSYWAERSLDFAFSRGATTASLIPTRLGNPALDELAARGEFAQPRIATLEACQEYGLRLRQGRVFADLWDLERFSACVHCYEGRYNRLQAMNLQQEIPSSVECVACQGKS